MRDHAAFKVGKQYVEGKFCSQANQRRWVCVGHRTSGYALIESCQNQVVTTVITPSHWSEVPSRDDLLSDIIEAFQVYGFDSEMPEAFSEERLRKGLSAALEKHGK